MANDPKIWVRVVESHATRTWVALILAIAASIALILLVGGAVWNTIATPEVHDLSANFMTVISGSMGIILGGLSGFLGYNVGTKKAENSGGFPGDESIRLEVDDQTEPD